MSGPLRIALLVPDNRDEFRQYDRPAPVFGPAPEALLHGLARTPGVEVHVIACTKAPLASPAKLADNIFYHSLLVPKLGWLRTGYQGCIRAIRRKVRELRPDLVHGQGTERYCALAAAFSGFPNVVTIHGNMRRMAQVNRARPGSFLWLSARLERFTLPRSHGVLCNSRHTAAEVRPWARRLWEVPNALREVFLAPPATTPRRQPPLLMNIGNLCEAKSQLELLNVAQRLHATGHRFVMEFIGRPLVGLPYFEEFQRRIGAAHGYVQYAGERTAAEICARLDEASALIHVPVEEAFGLVVAEALARNDKLFAFGVGGIPDIAEGVEGAELFPWGDWLGLEQAISRWLREGASPVRSAGGEMVRRYHPLNIAARHLAIYREVVAAEA